MKANAKYREKQAVSEIVGTMLVLGFSLSLFLMVNLFSFSFLSSDTIKAQVMCTLEDNTITFYHYGGQPISPSLKIILRYNNSETRINIGRTEDIPIENWYSSWKYRKEINIDKEKIEGTLEDFPILITLQNDNDLRDKANDQGWDIVFTEQDGKTKLNHEIEYYDNSSGTLISWVKIPLLKNTENTTIYIYYGKNNATSNENAKNVWRSNFLMVQHLNETSGNKAIDSTSYSNRDGTFNGDPVLGQSGKIGKAYYFDGTDDSVEIPRVFTDQNHFSIEAWVKYTSPPKQGYYIAQWSAKPAYHGAFLQICSGGDISEYYINDFHKGTSVQPDMWYYLALTYNGSHTNLYKNGELIHSYSYPGASTSWPNWPQNNTFIGDSSDGRDRHFKGLIDEVRLSNNNRSSAWIKTCYNNQNNPNVFYNIGAETEPSGYTYLNDINSNNKWDFSESIIYNLDENDRFKPIEYIILDEDYNKIIASGVIQESRFADLEINVDVDISNPSVNSFINFSITITNNGPSFAEDITLKFRLHENLSYHSCDLPGAYNPNTGIMDLGSTIIQPTDSILCRINTTYTGKSKEFTQLAVLLDGSGSVTNNNWNLTCEGISNAIRTGYIPHDETVELTAIQFGGNYSLPSYYPYAQVDIIPIILNESNYKDIANSIYDPINNTHLLRIDDRWQSETPIGCAIRLAADVLSGDAAKLSGTPEVGKESPNFNISNRQIIHLITDGVPNGQWIPGTYTAHLNYSAGKQSSTDARNYLISKLQLNENQDEFDCQAIGGSMYGGPDSEWLKNQIVWPTPGVYAPPYFVHGWVQNISSYSDFEDAFAYQMYFMFIDIQINAKIIDPGFIDIIEENNEFYINLNPED